MLRYWVLWFVFLIAFSADLYSQDPAFLSSKEEYATEQNKKASQDAFEKGYYYYNRMDYEMAVSYFRTALDLYPRNDLASYWLGRSYYMAGYNDLAITTWEKLLKSSGGSQDIFLKQELEKLYTTGLRTELSSDPSLYQFSFLRMINTFSNPSYIASDAQNNFYISDFYKNKINIYNASLSQIGVLDKNIDKPMNIAFKENLLYVSSYGNDSVQIFDMKNRYKPLYTIGGFGFGKGEFSGPMGLAFSGDRLYVVDQGNNRVQIFQTVPKSYFIGSFGKRGDGEGEFNVPTGIAVYDNMVWVLDTLNKRVQTFDLDGNYLSQISSPEINTPVQIFSFQEKLYVLDKNNGLFVINKSDEGKPLFKLLQKPTQGLERTTSAWFDNNGILFLSDVSNPTVIAYAREVDKLSPLDLQTIVLTTMAYPKIIMKLRVRDQKGRDIRGLSKDDFTVIQDGVNMSGINLQPVIPNNDQMKISVIIRTTKDMLPHKDSIMKYLDSLVNKMKNGDQIRLLTYNTKKVIVQPFTEDHLKLKESFSKIEWDNKEANDNDILDEVLYDSIDSNEFNDSHTALILIDNNTESPFKKYSAEAIASHAKRVGVPIYTVNMDWEQKNSIKNQVLDYLSQNSDGKNLYFGRSNNIFEIMEIVRENSPLFYTLSYTNPPIDRALYGYWASLVIRLNYRSLHGVSKIGYLVNAKNGN